MTVNRLTILLKSFLSLAVIFLFSCSTIKDQEIDIKKEQQLLDVLEERTRQDLKKINLQNKVILPPVHAKKKEYKFINQDPY